MLEKHLKNIYPERDSNIEHDESTRSLIRKKDAAQIKLNESALLIWQLCDGTLSIEAIIDSICNNYNLDRQAAADTILPLLQHLHDQQCLVFKQRAESFIAPTSPPLVNYHSIPDDLLENLENYRRLCEPWFPAAEASDDSDLSEAMLKQILKKPASRALSNPVSCDMNLLNTPGIVDSLIQSISHQIRALAPVNSTRLINSGHKLYGAGGSMGWHTNEDLPGIRVYCNWAENDDTNYFRYRDPDTGEIITQMEPAGWIVKTFYIPPRPGQLWHCLYAGSRRIALGFAEFEFGKIDQIMVS